MDHSITREILWNVPVAFIVIMYALLALLAVTFAFTGRYWYQRITIGRSESRFDRPLLRAWLMLRDAVGQGYVVRETWGWMHYAFYVGFVGLFIGTTIVVINSDVRALARLFGFDLYFYFGQFYLFFKAAMDTFFTISIVGVLAAGFRRAIERPWLLSRPSSEKLLNNMENRLGYWYPLLMLVLVVATGLMLEGARINATRPPFEEWAYLGRSLGRLEGALGAGGAFHRWLWLTHMLLVYALLFAFPFSKLRHFVIAPANLFFRNLGPRGRLQPITNFEQAESFGVGRIEQYSWKQLLDMAACLECGRCMINCPTATTGKALNPKYLVIEQREHLLAMAPALLAKKGNMDSVVTAGETAAADVDMIRDVVTEQAVWDCTNCGWCEEGCPVGIEHVQRIDDMRRYLVMTESRFPREAITAFKGIETQGNPWGLAQEKRADWAKGLGIPTLAEIGDPSAIEVLYWVGCAGSYDERNQKVSRALASLMKQAGVSFAILGSEETCTGDPARRLGNEYLYASVAKRNIETLKRYRPRRIVTQCPHCYHNLKKEYPDFGASDYEVVHEAEFLEELLRAGRLRFGATTKHRIAYHDPCFMARHDGKWESARALLSAIPGCDLIEAAQSKNRTYCCGAGGGCFWKEEIGGTRINERLARPTAGSRCSDACGWVSVLHDNARGRR